MLAESRAPSALTELASRTGLPRSTVHRIVRDLQRQLYVVPSSAGHGYTLGPGVLESGMNAPYGSWRPTDLSWRGSFERSTNTSNLPYSAAAKRSLSTSSHRRTACAASPRSARASPCMPAASARATPRRPGRRGPALTTAQIYGAHGDRPAMDPAQARGNPALPHRRRHRRA
ncbi:helix-turn-helix domain-containing protein [Nocardia vinacea]|uniref:Helix-turn-helix domain-containing protein n=1 Tax=Nocardia vinacea TaxID=96468 RepID=A0ABZ1ZC26_9NOCA